VVPGVARFAALVITAADVESPSGNVAFLFCDIEGSTRLWESSHKAMRPALPTRNMIVRAAIALRPLHALVDMARTWGFVAAILCCCPCRSHKRQIGEV
jgi:hypothetical protein